MVEEGGSDVVEVSEESEEAASQLVVPHLVKTGIFTQHIHLQHTDVISNNYMEY